MQVVFTLTGGTSMQKRFLILMILTVGLGLARGLKPTALTVFDSSNRAAGFSLRAYPTKKGRAL